MMRRLRALSIQRQSTSVCSSAWQCDLHAVERALRDGARCRRRDTELRPEQLRDRIHHVEAQARRQHAVAQILVVGQRARVAARFVHERGDHQRLGDAAGRPSAGRAASGTAPCARGRRAVARHAAKLVADGHALVGERDLADPEVVAQELRAAARIEIAERDRRMLHGRESPRISGAARAVRCSPTHSSIRSAISRLFASSIIMCVTPSMPRSSSFMYSAFAEPWPCARRALMASTDSWHCWLVAV